MKKVSRLFGALKGKGLRIPLASATAFPQILATTTPQREF
jgi:hypothetical protein